MTDTETGSVAEPSSPLIELEDMTDAERKRWKKAFNKYAIKEAEDDKKKGSSTRAPPKKKAPPVDEDEALKMKTEHIQNALWMADCNPLKEALDSFVQKCDPNKVGQVSFKEFLLCLRAPGIRKTLKGPSQSEVYEMLRVLDTEDEGYMTVEDLKACLMECGHDPFPEEEASDVVKAIAKVLEGNTIYIEDFVKKLCSS